MFDHVGRKIKAYAEAVSYIGIIVCILLGILSIILGLKNGRTSLVLNGNIQHRILKF